MSYEHTDHTDHTEPMSPALVADAVLELESMLGESIAISMGLPPTACADIATKMVKILRMRHASTHVYIPSPSRKERDAAIRAELRPGNAAEVAVRWGLSISAVYKIANRRSC